MAKKNDLPESMNQDDALTSSDALPNWDDVDKQYEELFGGFKETSDKPKSSKGKKEIKPEEPIQAGFDAEMIEAMACMPFDMIFERRGWKKLTNIERKAWSESISNLLNKYMPMMSKWSVEIAPVLCLATMLGTRIDWSKANATVSKSNHNNIGATGNRENNMGIQEPKKP